MSVQRILKYFGLKRQISARVPLLTKNMRMKRLAWAKKYVKRPIVQWRRVFLLMKKFSEFQAIDMACLLPEKLLKNTIPHVYLQLPSMEFKFMFGVGLVVVP